MRELVLIAAWRGLNSFNDGLLKLHLLASIFISSPLPQDRLV